MKLHRSIRPFGVDASSGVETEPGKKSPELIRAFCAAVRFSLEHEIIHYAMGWLIVVFLAAMGIIARRSHRGMSDALALRMSAIEAAEIVFRVCHQLHGAVGFCDETTLSWLSRYSQPHPEAGLD